MDGEASWATVHEVTKSQTQLSDSTSHFHHHKRKLTGSNKDPTQEKIKINKYIKIF